MYETGNYIVFNTSQRIHSYLLSSSFYRWNNSFLQVSNHKLLTGRGTEYKNSNKSTSTNQTFTRNWRTVKRGLLKFANFLTIRMLVSYSIFYTFKINRGFTHLSFKILLFVNYCVSNNHNDNKNIFRKLSKCSTHCINSIIKGIL